MTRKNRDVVVDVEADGPAPGLYSMISFGAVIVENGLQRTFSATLRPISDIHVPTALAVSGFTREQTMKFPDPYDAMLNFDLWLGKHIEGRPILWADNNGFDAAFINYYFWRYLNRNPFGWSSANIGTLYKGVTGDLYSRFTHLRDTPHTHDPLDDALGNAEALIKIFNMMKVNGKT